MTHWDEGDWTDIPPTVPDTPQPTVVIPAADEVPIPVDDGEVEEPNP